MSKRRLAQPAWKDLLWALVGFAVVQLVLAVAIEGWLDGVRDPEFSAKLIRLQARRSQAPDAPLIVALGSSRTKLGLVPSLTAEAGGKGQALLFNFGMSGNGPMLQQLALRRLLARSVRPDFVFVELTTTSLLQDGRMPLEEKWLDGSHLQARELSVLRPYYSRLSRLLLRWASCRLLPCNGHAADLYRSLALESNKLVTMDGYGWQPAIYAVTDTERAVYTEMTRHQYEDVLRTFQFAPESLHALDDLLGLCREQGIPFAVLAMPEAESFRALYPLGGEAAFQALLARLHAVWQAPVIDARAWIPESGFWDSHHLLPLGAMAFTERFDREVMAPLLDGLGR